jgi:hypothetical protein
MRRNNVRPTLSPGLITGFFNGFSNGRKPHLAEKRNRAHPETSWLITRLKKMKIPKAVT